MAKVWRSKQVGKIVITTLLVLLIILSLKIDQYQKELSVTHNNQSQVGSLLFGENRAPGLSCGVLTKAKAESLLDVDVDRNFVQGADNLATENSPDSRVFWTDNCRYVDPNNSNKYIELYINSYQTADDAKAAYPKILNKVNENAELSADGIGQRLTYDNGVFSLLRNSRIIQVAFSDGNSKNMENARKIFDDLISGLDS